MNLAATSRLSGVAVSFLLLSGCGSGVGSETAVPPPPSETITITTNPFIQCVQSVPFSLTLKAQGNSGPVTWSVSSGQMAAGLTLDSQTGIISGTPISSSGETVNIQAADARANSIKQFNFVVFTKLVINPVTPANAHLNAPYSQTIAAQASSAIASWTVSAGQLPPGLTVATSDYNLDTAIISGTPTQLGTYNFTIQAQDYTIPQITSVALTIIIDSHVALTKSSLQNGGQNQIYSDTFTAIDGSPPYQWSIAGILPSGISMNSSTGKVTGTPTDFGSFSYTVTVTDSSNPLQSDSAQNALYIAQQLQIFTNIGNANINSPFNSSFYAIGGTYPYVWSVISGSLPPGLGLYPNGVVQGTPTQLGSFPFVIQATDSGKPPYVVSHAVTLNVTPTPLP
jgi:hypothetical protein